MDRETELARLHDDCATIDEVLRKRAAERGGELAYRFLKDGEGAGLEWSYRTLSRRAEAIAAHLRGELEVGSRALLVHPPGPELFAAFFGCLRAGVIAVPAYPPDPTQLDRSLPRLEGILLDAGCGALLTTTPLAAMGASLVASRAAFEGLRWIATDAIEVGAEARGREEIDPESVAFLQYTSGSTGDPKGVVVTHRNILENLALIHRSVLQGPESHFLLWLPPYHDMGLMNTLYAVAVGCPCTSMSPAHFLRRPVRWLEAISRFGATYSGGPNFAYDLCLRKVRPEDKEGLDLSRWEVAFNGAEPIRAGTLDAFSEAFSCCGFQRRAFHPCYGLAEFTVDVTGGSVAGEPVVRRFDERQLRLGRAIPTERADDARPLVGCGEVKGGHELRIVDPQLCVDLPEGLIGEIWARGPSKAKGYWGREEQSLEVFEAALRAGDEGGYLRTGDLGFLHEGELFVTGRIKELIVVRGRNHYPHDLERSAEAVDPRLRPGCVAAFAVPTEEGEGVALALELTSAEIEEAQELMAAIRGAISEQHELALSGLRLLPPRTLPKTSSGKLQRDAIRARWLRGDLPTVASWGSTGATTSGAHPAEPPPSVGALSEVHKGGGSDADADAVEAWLKERFAARLGVAPDQIQGARSIASLGLGSLALLELAEELSLWLGRGVPHTFAWAHPTLRAAAQALAAERRAGGSLPEALAKMPQRRPREESAGFYVSRETEEEIRRTNEHYMLPRRFFEVMTGGRWNIYSCNLWGGIADPDPASPEQQTRSQESKLDVFAELIGARPGMRVLDLGCGHGGALCYLADRYGVSGVGISPSSEMVRGARERATRLGLGAALRFSVSHWRELEDQERFDAILSDEVIVHFADLEACFGHLFGLLREDGVMVHKELHFTHPGYGEALDPLSVVANDIFGSTGAYRSLADELRCVHAAGFHLDSIRELSRRDYWLTATSWYRNLRSHEEEMVALVGAETYLHFLKWISWIQLGPGGGSDKTPIMSCHFVKSRKGMRESRERLGIRIE